MKSENKIKSTINDLDNMVLCCSSKPHSALVITDASIKNDIATSISHQLIDQLSKQFIMLRSLLV